MILSLEAALWSWPNSILSFMKSDWNIVNQPVAHHIILKCKNFKKVWKKKYVYQLHKNIGLWMNVNTIWSSRFCMSKLSIMQVLQKYNLWRKMLKLSHELYFHNTTMNHFYTLWMNNSYTLTQCVFTYSKWGIHILKK